MSGRLKYSDQRSNDILLQLKKAYAHQTQLLIHRVAKENCIQCYGLNYECEHTEDLTWEEKVTRFGRMALVRVREEDVMTEWLKLLDREVTPPAHPTECPELMDTMFRWTELIDEMFTEEILKYLVGCNSQLLMAKHKPYYLYFYLRTFANKSLKYICDRFGVRN